MPEIYSGGGLGRHAIGGYGVAGHSTGSSRGLSSHRLPQSLRGLILMTRSEVATVSRERRVSCGGNCCVWRARVRFRDAGKHDDVQQSLRGITHENQDTQNSPIIVEKRLSECGLILKKYRGLKK
jgi:hypothetical protein